MAKFIVKAYMTNYFDAEVEADSIEEAREKAMELDGRDFIESSPFEGDWGITNVYEVTE